MNTSLSQPNHSATGCTVNHDATCLTATVTLCAAEPALNNGKKEVAFLDTGVTDWQTLAGYIHAGVEVVLLDNNQDGLMQMAAWAQDRSGYDAIHIISHGSTGKLLLGTSTVTNASLNDSAVQEALTRLTRTLTVGGDLLLYGCSVAVDAEGEQFVDNLSKRFDINVAASNDLTGASGQGGDWMLEVSSNGMPMTGLFSAEGNGHTGRLAAPVAPFPWWGLHR